MCDFDENFPKYICNISVIIYCIIRNSNGITVLMPYESFLNVYKYRCQFLAIQCDTIYIFAIYEKLVKLY
jgi:hypothetical protein